MQETDLLSEIIKLKPVLGCGFCRDSLHVYIDQDCDNREKIEEGVRAKTYIHGIEKVEFKYFLSRIVEFATSGNAITCSCEKRGTLAGFCKKENNLYGLISNHIAAIDQDLGTTDGNRLGKLVKQSKNFDIALVQIDEENVTRCDKSLKDEGGQSFEIPCKVHNDPADLQDLPVYITGAETKLGIGRIDIPFFQTKEGRHIVVRNFLSENFCTNGDSGAMVLGRARGNLNEVWPIGIVRGAFTSTKGDKTGESKHERPHLVVELQAGLDDLSTDEQGAFELVYQNE